MSSQSVLRCIGVQAIAASNEPSTTFVFPAGGYKEPGQDCTAGRCSPRPHGGGEGPAAGQRFHRGQGWRWRHSIALHCLRVRTQGHTHARAFEFLFTSLNKFNWNWKHCLGRVESLNRNNNRCTCLLLFVSCFTLVIRQRSHGCCWAKGQMLTSWTTPCARRSTLPSIRASPTWCECWPNIRLTSISRWEVLESLILQTGLWWTFRLQTPVKSLECFSHVFHSSHII